MDDHAIHERGDSEAESTGFGGERWLQAASGVWQARLVGAATVLVARYFFVAESVWPNTAETFYAPTSPPSPWSHSTTASTRCANVPRRPDSPSSAGYASG